MIIQRYYDVTYTRILGGTRKLKRLTATDVRMSEKSLKEILLDNSRYKYIVEKAVLVDSPLIDEKA